MNALPEWVRDHPISCVQWVPIEEIFANDYNPNSVAPNEMKLLELSILSDGYTQPIVVWKIEKGYEVIDGFHRFKIGKKLKYSHLPIVVVNPDRTKKKDRIASTIRHNRARGKHSVSLMSDIVKELSRLKWKDEQISKELGMDMDEVLRLKQISGLAESFQDSEFSAAWEIEEK